MAWIGRELGGFTIQNMAKELGQDTTVLIRGLAKMAQELGNDPKLRSIVEKLCNDLRKGRRPKRSVRYLTPMPGCEEFCYCAGFHLEGSLLWILDGRSTEIFSVCSTYRAKRLRSSKRW